MIIHVKRHPLECIQCTLWKETQGTNKHTHTYLQQDLETVLDQPNLGLKGDQRFSKLVETHLPLPGMTHIKFTQYRVQIHKTNNKKQVTPWRTDQLTTNSENITGGRPKSILKGPNTPGNTLYTKGKKPKQAEDKGKGN